MRESRASFLSIRISIVRKWRERLRPQHCCCFWRRPSFRRHRPGRRADLPDDRLPRTRPAEAAPPQTAPRRDPATTASPSKPTTTTSSSTSTATPCCRATSSCARATRSSAPIAWNTTRRTASAKLDGAVEFSIPRSRSAAAAAAIPRRSARNSKARSSSCRQRNARGAARNMHVDAERHGHARRRVVHHLPGHATSPGS